MVCCGRRWGKTYFGMDLAAEMALCGHPVAWFAPTYKYLADVWRDMRETLLPYASRSDATEKRIELVTGGSVDMWSLDGGDAGRGRKYARVVIDEAALVADLSHVWAAAIRPTLTDLVGDGWFLSTPRSRNGFWELYQHGLDPLQPDWQCWQMPTSTNPYINPDEIEAARTELPQRIYQQEYLAEFLEDSAVFRYIREAATATEQRSAQAGHEYTIGIDWGQIADYSVFSVIDVTTGELCYLDRSNHIEYLTQLQRLKHLRDRFAPRTIIVEANRESTLMELLRRESLPVIEFTTSAKTKPPLIEDLMLAFEQRRLQILPDPVLIGELQAFEATPQANGYIKYAAPAGYHDDCVMSLALAWSVAKHGAAGGVRVKQRPMVR